MDIEKEDSQSFLHVEGWINDDSLSKTSCPLFVTPEHLRESLESARKLKPVRLDFNSKNPSQKSRRPSLLQRLDNPQFCSSGDQCNLTSAMTIEISSFSPDHSFKTPPKKPHHDVQEDRTKRSYLERKQLRDDDEDDSRFDTDYEVLGSLGSGSFGMVKKCLNKVDQSVYAVKIMNCHDRKNINEVKALATLSNKGCSHIVRYHHSWIEHRQLFMVMQYCEATLSRILEDRRKNQIFFSEEELKKIAVDMLRALNELHGHNVVHLDVKPDNILRTFQGRFKLGDLGLCRTATLNYGEDINEGDSKYMAREILNNFNQQEIPDLTKADLFSLGMTLYELATLDILPSNGPLWHELREGSLQIRLSACLSRYSRSFIKIVKNMIESKFQSRSSASELLSRPYFSESCRRRPLQSRHFSI